MSTFLKIKPSEIIIDPTYQRALEKPRVASMVKAYDPSLVGVVIVSRRRDGKFYGPIDGQHRVDMLLQKGLGDVPILMEVVDGLTLKQEAELFLRFNGSRKSIKAFDKFKARLVAQDRDALQISRILSRHGCKIARANMRFGVTAIEAAEAAYNAGTLETTIIALIEWLDGDAKSFRNGPIRAISTFLKRYDHARPKYLAKKLGDMGYDADKLELRLHRERQTGESSADLACRVLFGIYNKGTRPGRSRLEWIPSGQSAASQKPAQKAQVTHGHRYQNGSGRALSEDWDT